MMTDAERDADLLKLARAEAWKEGFDAGVKAAEVIPGSPQLDEPTRTRCEVALEIAIREMKAIVRMPGIASRSARCDVALAKIRALVPDAVPGEAVEREGR